MIALPLIVSTLLSASPATAPAKATAAEAKAFVDAFEKDYRRLSVTSSTAEWIRQTYITEDTERNSATFFEEQMEFLSRSIKGSMRFKGLALDPDTDRQLALLRVSTMLPAPTDQAKRAELALLATELDGLYGKGKWCGPGYTPGKDAAADKKKCRAIGELEETLAKSRKYDELLDAWAGWHSISRPMRPKYERLISLANEGAKDIGFKNLGDLWRSAYDMAPESFEKETDRLWTQLKPLYDDLHCYVRSQLSRTYGADKVPAAGMIPAHLLGNMWAQEWGNIYPLVEPYRNQPSLDVTAELKRQKYDARRMVKLGESFFTSLGLDPLPATFWERSQFTKPPDREVVCHASAWDVTLSNDLRVKMCIKVNEEDLGVIHHELGHNYYFQSYYKLPTLYQQGANDGFHEAIGDALVLSITPEYLKKVKLLQRVPTDEKGLLNVQMKDALDTVPFLPFARMIDQWRWDVMSGKTAPANYNAAWWELRRKYQGVDAPAPRTEDDFDPGAKYHIPANVPYMRYFLARVLQFQFHRAMCQVAEHKGPLWTCSIYGNKKVGEKLKAMLALGASKPWPEALFALTGQKEMDASALTEYFQPLQTWLKTQNRGKTCGW